MRFGRSQGDDPRDLRREREALEKLRAEIGQRFTEVQRRELEAQRLLATASGGGAPGGSPSMFEADLERALEAKEAELLLREQELAEREATFAAAVPPADPDARLTEIEMRLAELQAAEEVFLRTRRDLEERSAGLEAMERRLRARELELDERARPVVALPAVEPPPPVEITAEPEGGFSAGLMELQRRGLRRPRGRAGSSRPFGPSAGAA